MKLPIVAAVAAAAVTIAVVRGIHPAPAAPFVADSSPEPVASASLVRRPVASAAREKIVVYVAGAVRNRGLYTLALPARANDALRAAGGATHDADLTNVNLAASLEDGDQVTVPAVDSDASQSTSASPSTGHHRKHRHKHKRKHRHRTPEATADAAESASGDVDATTPLTVVDLNTADVAELETLPGVGATLAGRIVAFRELTGPFASTDDLLDVAGVTSSKLDAIAPYVRATAP